MDLKVYTSGAHHRQRWNEEKHIFLKKKTKADDYLLLFFMRVVDLVVYYTVELEMKIVRTIIAQSLHEYSCNAAHWVLNNNQSIHMLSRYIPNEERMSSVTYIERDSLIVCSSLTMDNYRSIITLCSAWHIIKCSKCYYVAYYRSNQWNMQRINGCKQNNC